MLETVERIEPARLEVIPEAISDRVAELSATTSVLGHARRVLNDLVTQGLLGSATPKGAVSLKFPVAALDVLFPRLFAKG